VELHSNDRGSDLETLQSELMRLEAKRRALLTRRGHPKPGLQEMEAELRRQIEELHRKIVALQQGESRQVAPPEEVKPEKEKGEKEVVMPKDKASAHTQAPATALAPAPLSNVRIQVELEIVYNAFMLGGKGQPSRASVPVGRVFVLSHDHDTYDQEGLPEVYLAGEVVSKNRLWGKAQCWVVELAEFPGKVSFRVIQPLAAISQTEDDVASLDASLYIRLQDPILLLRRVGGKWMTEQDRISFNKRVEEDIQRRLEQVLAGRIQLWSGDERQVYDRLFSGLDGELERIGLRVDTTNAMETSIIAIRRYPANLYEVALQLAKAGRMAQYMIDAGQQEVLLEQTGLSQRNLTAIEAVSEERGVGLFLVFKDASPEAKEKMAGWLEAQGAKIAATFAQKLYSEEHEEREVKLSEQVLLAALRNPMLTIGEWLQKESETPQVTLFQRLQSRLGMVSSSA